MSALDEPTSPSPSEGAPPENPARRAVVVTVVVVALLAVVVAVVAIAGGDDLSRQEVVAERGAEVMPFDLEATTHVFDATSTGGVQTVVADDPTDREQVVLIRGHLRDEVARFRAGDFGDPATIHGHDMPGLDTLEDHADAIRIRYRDRRDGGQVTYQSDDPTVVDALHDWFDAQVADHGAHAQPG